MKLAKIIKRFVGLIYVLGFSFSAVGINKSVQSRAVEEYDTGISFAGSWSTEVNSGTQQTELCYTGSEDQYSGIQYFFNAQSATYYSLSETADIICAVYYYDTNNQNAATDLNGESVTIHLDNVSEPQINAANGTYPISGDFPNDGVGAVSFSVSANSYAVDGYNIDPHVPNSSGWVTDSGVLKYMYDSENEATYEILYVEYHTESVDAQNSRDELILNVDVSYEGNIFYHNAGVQINTPSFSPQISVGDATFEGTISGYCEQTRDNTSVELDGTEPFCYITDGWSYDPYHKALLYNTAEYSEPNCSLEYVDINPDDEIELQYYSEKYGIDFYATLTNASSGTGNDGDYVTGDIALNNLQDEITVEILIGNATVRNNVPNVGWNYDDNDHYIYYQDSDEHPDSSYELSSVIYKYESEEVVFYCQDTEEYDTDIYTFTISNAEYDDQENQVHGYTDDLDSPRTEVTVSLGSLTLQEVEYWDYRTISDEDYFVWVAVDGTEVNSNTLSISSAKFYEYSSNHSNDYFEIVYTYQQAELPTLHLSGASYETTTPPTGGDGYTVSGFCDYEKINRQASVFISVFDTIQAERDDGWYFENETFYYYYNNQQITPTLVSCDFYQYGNSDNYCEIVYSAQITGADPVQTLITITDAGYRDLQDQQETGYYVSGYYEAREISVYVESLVNHVINHYEYDGTFIYVLPDEGIQMDCEVTQVVFNNFGNGGNYSEAYVTFRPYREFGGNKDYYDDGIDTLYLCPASLTIDPRVAQGNGELTGTWNGYQDATITFGEDTTFIENDLKECPEGIHYLNGCYKLVYFDDMGSLYYVVIDSCTYDIEHERITVEYLIERIEETGSFVLKDAYFSDLGDSNKNGRYQVNGTNEDIYDSVMVLFTNNLYTEDNRVEGWNYIDGNLVWYDPTLGDFVDSNIETVTLFRTVGNNQIEYVEVKYALYGLNVEDPDAPTYKTVTLTQVQIESFPMVEEQKPGILTGYFNTLSIRVRIVAMEFIEKELNDEATTITPEQEAVIIEYMPEITPETPEEEQRQERNEESLKQLSEKTAAEILSAVSSSQSDIVQERDKKIAEATSEEEIAQAHQEYQEKREIIETVTEASVVVGADQQTASDEGNKVDQALPADSGLDSMGEVLDEFYQTQMDYLLGRKKAPEKRIILRDPTRQQTGIDMSISKEEYGNMIKFVDTAVSNMKSAALQIRKCSSAKMKVVVKDYISVVKVSSFREFNEEAANAEYVEAVYKATMLNMQQQVVEALKREHKPSNNAERERQYQEQLAACENYETFEQIVIEVLRLKYDSIEGEKLTYVDANDFFDNIYMPIFKSWALDDPSINPTNITLEELTKATIETTTAKAAKMTFRADVSKEESTFLIILGASLGAGCIAGITLPIVFRKRRRGLAK